MKEKYYKAFNFDLDTSQLKKNYPGLFWRRAYKDIGKFLKDNEFTHRQGSGYVSNKPLSDAEATFFVQKLTSAFAWFEQCVKIFDITNVGDTYSALDVIKEQAQINRAAKQTYADKEQTESLDDLMKRHKDFTDQMNKKLKGRDEPKRDIPKKDNGDISL